MGSSLARGILGLGALLALLCGAGCNLITGADGLEIGDDGDGGGDPDTSSGSGSSGQGASGAGTTAGPATCGDAACNGAETCADCAGDCGPCGPGAPVCGDATCNGAETCADCPGDCGPCGPMCGDGTCNGSETCDTCASDCGECDPCGDGACAGGETCDTCASDCGACDTCQGSGDATTPLDNEEEAFLVLINDYRAQNGLGSLTPCTSLNRTAQGHSEDMRDKNYFSHTGLNGSSPWGRACDACYELGCGPQTAMAENIAAGNSGAQATFLQWKNSPGHNANMLGGNFTMIGIGRATGGGQYGVYWTNVFGGDSEASCN